MKQWKRSMVSLLLLVMLLLTSCAPAAYNTYDLTPNEYLMGEDGSQTGVYTPDGSTVQLTVEDIQAMNGGNAYMLFDSDGYLNFLNGRYYNGKVANQEDAVASIQGIAKLLGLGAGSEFYCLFGERDKNNYTYYTFQQRYGESTVQYASLRIAVDPEGYPCGLACSFEPNLGIVEEVEWITPEQAVEAANNVWEQLQLTIYPEYTRKVSITISEMQFNCYAVYAANPVNDAVLAGQPYWEILVTHSGEYIATRSTSYIANTTIDEKAYEYFEGKTPITWTGTVAHHDGTTETITVPVAYSESEGLYYLMDVERKIAVADYAAMEFTRHVDFLTSYDGTTWNNKTLWAYYNYIRVYDYFAERGYRSSDGTGVPILVLDNYVDQNGNPVDNACSIGIINGFACFATSRINNYGEAVDVCCHEFTHGFTSYSMGGMEYLNETGAINEAFSDIFGNIVEMSLGATWDQDAWLIGEMSGRTDRCMSNPNIYYQPVSKSDPYFCPPIPDDKLTDWDYIGKNDMGGVHINNSLLGQMAYKLFAAGMSMDDQMWVWMTCCELMTPRSGYREVYGALMMSLEINGLSQYGEVMTDAFLAAELITEQEAKR